MGISRGGGERSVVCRSRRTTTPDTSAEKFESFVRIDSIHVTTGNFDSSNSHVNDCRLVPSRNRSKFSIFLFMYPGPLSGVLGTRQDDTSHLAQTPDRGRHPGSVATQMLISSSTDPAAPTCHQSATADTHGGRSQRQSAGRAYRAGIILEHRLSPPPTVTACQHYPL